MIHYRTTIHIPKDLYQEVKAHLARQEGRQTAATFIEVAIRVHLAGQRLCWAEQDTKTGAKGFC